MRAESAEGGVQRAGAAGHLQSVAADEAPARVALVELLAHDDAAQGAHVAVQLVVEDAGNHGVGVEHEVGAHQAVPVRKPVGEPSRLRAQEDARRAHAVAGHNDDAGPSARAGRRRGHSRRRRSPGRRRRR